MNIVLKKYQETAVTDCLNALGDAAYLFERRGSTAAVSLTAATSAGKTIIATSLIERMRFGGDDHPEEPDFTVLWLTNSPSLNRQTMMKMRGTSSRLTDSHLVEIDEGTSGHSLPAGKVYFLNTQKLAVGATSYQASESRPVSLMQMIRNTVDALGPKFLLIIDEAHIGTRKNENGKDQLAAKVMNGVDGQSAFPLVLGISATSQRFRKAINESSTRTLYSVAVPVRDVRESGLIKDRILAHVPRDSTLAEGRMLRDAVAAWERSDRAWSNYHANNPETASVHPLLVVQVPAGIDDNRLASILSEIREANPALTGNAVAHAFGTHQAHQVGAHTTLDFIEPENIQGATYVRVVLFKDALTTGWDCPRAEVMLSLRSSSEETTITQMVGRMVRTPLARRIDGEEALNDVTLFLPLYNQETVAKIANELSDGNSDTGVAATVEVAPVEVSLIDAVTGVRPGEVLAEDDTVLRALRRIQGYSRPRQQMSPVARLGKTAALLEQGETPIVTGAEQAADATLRVALHNLYLAHQTAIDEALTVATKTEVDVVNLGDGIGGVKRVKEGEAAEAYTTEGDPGAFEAEQMFKAAGHNCGSPKTVASLWRQFAGAGLDSAILNEADMHIETKIKAALIGLLPEAKNALASSAEAKFQEWRRAHDLTLIGRHRSEWTDIKAATVEGAIVPVNFPDQFTTGGTHIAPAGHIYVDANGHFPINKPLTSWETSTIAGMQEKFPHFIGWWRNGTGGDKSLGVRYINNDANGTIATMYPDFVGIYRDGDKVTLRIFDPHADYHDGKSRVKWVGLADYLESDANHYVDANGERVRVFDTAYGIINSKRGELLAIDLSDKEIVELLRDANIDLESAVFETKGSRLN